MCGTDFEAGGNDAICVVLFLDWAVDYGNQPLGPVSASYFLNAAAAFKISARAAAASPQPSTLTHLPFSKSL